MASCSNFITTARTSTHPIFRWHGSVACRYVHKRYYHEILRLSSLFPCGAPSKVNMPATRRNSAKAVVSCAGTASHGSRGSLVSGGSALGEFFAIVRTNGCFRGPFARCWLGPCVS